MKATMLLCGLLSFSSLCLGDDIAVQQGTLYGGLWAAGSDANYYSVGMSLSGFQDLATQRHGQGLRIVDLETYLKDGVRKWAAIWRSGTYANYFTVDLTADALKYLATQRHGQGLRLVDLETYTNGSQRYWVGLWRTGTDANYYSIDLTLSELVTLATQRHQQGLRIVDLETYLVSGQRRWAAVWRSGTDANYFSVDLTGPQFSDLLQERHQQNLRIVSFTSYVDGGVRKWAGVWRSGTYANYVTTGGDLEYLRGLARQRHQNGLRMIGLDIYGGACDDGCLNQVVMPEQVTLTDGTTQQNGGYVYGIPRTALHCPGAPNTCGAAPTGNVGYRWPVDMAGDDRYLRPSAVTNISPFLKLPFKDTAVKRRGIWRYGNNGYHHAGDYSRDDVGSFNVVASAAGRVIYAGWDSWSGNTIIVSHTVGGVQDAYRTIYMHLRNGPVNDCQQAWNVTVPTLSGATLTNYRNYLNNTGCTQTRPSPAQAQWGTSTDVINASLVGQQVQAGQVLARAGSTGPGGCGCTTGGNGPNTHLHIFWVRRDMTDNQWYFFDPYGIYSTPEWYPSTVTGTVSTPCARYPVAWIGSKPQYP